MPSEGLLSADFVMISLFVLIVNIQHVILCGDA